MKSSENDRQLRPKRYSDLTLDGVDPFIKGSAERVEKLSKKVLILPQVDEKGRSECPFAEDLYAEKDETAEKIAETLEKLKRYLELVEQQVARCRKNLNQIRADGSSLHLDEAKERYAQAQRAQELELKKAIERRKGLLDLIAKTEKTLREARDKKFPGKKPEKRYRPRPVFADEMSAVERGGFPTSSPITPIPKPSFQTEVDNLIALGPLGKKGN